MTNHFAEIHEQMQSGEGNTGPSAADTQSQGTEVGKSNNPDQEAASSILELDKLEKFKFKDQEWTRDELEKAIMRQSDYTKKTQAFAKEREQILNEKKFADNLADDLEHIAQNPKLLEEFKKIYPKSYHAVADRYAQSLTGASPQQEQTQGSRNDLEAKLLARLEELEGRINPVISERDERVSQMAVQAVDEIFESNLKKYDLANESHVHMLATQALERGEQLDREAFEKLFKQSHEAQEKQFQGYYKKKFGEQKAANEKARSPGGNSATPNNAPQKMNLKQAREAMLKTYGAS